MVPKSKATTIRAARRAAPSRGQKMAAKESRHKDVRGIIEELRIRITRQEIAPGAKLSETSVAEEFGVPRTRVRDALAILEQRGLVERIPNRGAVVMRLDLRQAFEIYDLREVLEGLCARLATQRGPVERWRKDLDLFQGPMRELIACGNVEAYFEHYEALRRRLIEAAGSPLLTEMLDSIYEKTRVIINRIIILPGRAETGRAEHEAMLDAMCRGLADKAERLRRRSLRNGRAYLERYQKFIL